MLKESVYHSAKPFSIWQLASVLSRCKQPAWHICDARKQIVVITLVFNEPQDPPDLGRFKSWLLRTHFRTDGLPGSTTLIVVTTPPLATESVWPVRYCELWCPRSCQRTTDRDSASVAVRGDRVPFCPPIVRQWSLSYQRTFIVVSRDAMIRACNVSIRNRRALRTDEACLAATAQ